MEDQLTICTAVGGRKKYLNAFERNIKNWGACEFFHDKKWIVFAHINIVHEVAKVVSDNQKLFPKSLWKVVSWEFPEADSSREEMLSAFVFGVVEEVKTKYWIKLDCDCHLKDTNNLVLPKKWNKYTLNGHRWTYTKCKWDPLVHVKGNWLNRLDDWADNLPDFKGTKRLFRPIKGERHGHRRICTFFAIEKTAWTKHLAKMCMDSCGRMPIPSQDTLTWYAVTRMADGREVNYFNFRRYWHTR